MERDISFRSSFRSFKFHDSSVNLGGCDQDPGSFYSSGENVPRYLLHSRIPPEFPPELHEPGGIGESSISNGQCFFKNLRTAPPRAYRSYLLNLDKNNGLRTAYLGTPDRLTSSKCRSMELASRTEGHTFDYNTHKDSNRRGSCCFTSFNEQHPQINKKTPGVGPDVDYGSRDYDHPAIKSGTCTNTFGNSYKGQQSDTIYLDERRNALRYNVDGMLTNRGYEGDKDFMDSIDGLDSQGRQIAISRYLAQKTITPQIDPIQNGFPGPSPDPFYWDSRGVNDEFPRIPSVHPGITSKTITWGALNSDQKTEQILHNGVHSTKEFGSLKTSTTNLQRVSLATHG